MVIRIGKWQLRSLVIWWLSIGVVLALALILLWANRQTNDSVGGSTTPARPVGGPVEIVIPAGSGLATSSPTEPASVGLPPAVGPAPASSSPVVGHGVDQGLVTAPDPEAGQASLTSVDGQPASQFPDDWEALSPADKIALNPLGCDLTVEEVDVYDGHCRRRLSLSSSSQPWNPIGLNRVSTVELDRKPVQLACFTQDLSSLRQDGHSRWADKFNQRNLRPQDPVNIKTDDRLACLLRVTLEMTIDDFYFSTGCRDFRPRFVQLALTHPDGSARNYGSLSPIGAHARCTKAIVAVSRGDQIEQVFLFNVTARDLDSRLTQIKFNQLTPTPRFEGNFSLQLYHPPEMWSDL